MQPLVDGRVGVQLVRHDHVVLREPVLVHEVGPDRVVDDQHLIARHVVGHPVRWPGRARAAPSTVVMAISVGVQRGATSHDSAASDGSTAAVRTRPAAAATARLAAARSAGRRRCGAGCARALGRPRVASCGSRPGRTACHATGRRHRERPVPRRRVRPRRSAPTGRPDAAAGCRAGSRRLRGPRRCTTAGSSRPASPVRSRPARRTRACSSRHDRDGPHPGARAAAAEPSSRPPSGSHGS